MYNAGTMLMQRVTTVVRGEGDRLDRFIESRIEDVLSRLNIPSRSDIERLNASVDLLSAKVDALLSRQAARSNGTIAIPPARHRGN